MLILVPLPLPNLGLFNFLINLFDFNNSVVTMLYVKGLLLISGFLSNTNLTNLANPKYIKSGN